MIDLGACPSYVSPKIVENFKLHKIKFNKPWLVQLANGVKRKISELIKGCEIDMNGLETNVNFEHINFGNL